MTTEEKAKRYDEAIERAKAYQGLRSEMEIIFPELKESEDEKMMRVLIGGLKSYIDMYSEWYDGVSTSEILAWLEKQGEQKLYVNDNAKEMFIKALERVEEQKNKGYKLTDCDKNSWWEDFKAYTSCIIEQKPVDKVEPKFKVGDKIYLKPEYRMPDDDTPIANTVFEIRAIDDKHYRFDGSYIFIEDQDNYELVEQKPVENKGMNLVEEEMTPFQKKVFCIIDTTIEEEQGLKQVCDELLTLASNEIKQKPTTEIKSAEESLGIDSETYNKIVDECIYGEQKPADKIKPKFKVDDWIIKNDDSHINIDYICCKIIKVENGNYTIESIYGYKGYNTFDTFEKDYHLWTIQDAKDGDVLACDSKHGQEIGIVKKYIGKYGGCDSCFETYCFVDWDDIFRVGEYMGSRNIHPATKEQRDLLFKKMKEAGYEFEKLQASFKKYMEK